jgi:hypothetical protein
VLLTLQKSEGDVQWKVNCIMGTKNSGYFKGTGKQRESKGVPRNNQKQNAQARNIANVLGLTTKKQKQQLHRLIGGRGLDYQEALEEARIFFEIGKEK